MSVVLEATQEASRGPLKGTVSAQKAPQGSEAETRELLEGTEEEKYFFDEGSMTFCEKGAEKNRVSGQTWSTEVSIMALLLALPPPPAPGPGTPLGPPDPP